MPTGPGVSGPRRKGGEGARSDLAIQIEGLAPLRKALRQTEQNADRHVRGSLREIADTVRDRARANAPQRTGALSRSIKSSVAQRRVSIRSTLPYAPVHEYGGRVGRNRTARVKGSRFMKRAVEESRPEVSRRLAGLLDAIADDFGKGDV